MSTFLTILAIVYGVVALIIVLATIKDVISGYRGAASPMMGLVIGILWPYVFTVFYLDVIKRKLKR